MGNKCCALPSRKVQSFNSDKVTEANILRAESKDLGRKMQRGDTIQQNEEEYYENQMEEYQELTTINNHMNNFNIGLRDSNNRMSEEMPASPSSKQPNQIYPGAYIQHSMTLQVPRNSSRGKRRGQNGNNGFISAGEEEDKGDSYGLEVPKYKVSPTIGISREWIQLKQTMKSSELQPDIGYLSEDTQPLQMIRRESSIHQIFEKQSTYSPRKSQFSYQNTLGMTNLNGGFEFTLQKLRQSNSHLNSGRLESQGVVKSGSLNSNKLSARLIDGENIEESDDPGFSRANSLQQINQQDQKDQDKIKVMNSESTSQVQSYQCLSPGQTDRISFGIRDQGKFVKNQNTGHFRMDSKMNSQGSHIKDQFIEHEIEEEKQITNPKEKMGDQSNFAQFVQEYMFKRSNSTKKDDELESPVLGKYKSIKQEDQQIKDTHDSPNPIITDSDLKRNPEGYTQFRIQVDQCSSFEQQLKNESQDEIRIINIPKRFKRQDLKTITNNAQDVEEIDNILEQLVPIKQKSPMIGSLKNNSQERFFQFNKFESVDKEISPIASTEDEKRNFIQRESQEIGSFDLAKFFNKQNTITGGLIRQTRMLNQQHKTGSLQQITLQTRNPNIYVSESSSSQAMVLKSISLQNEDISSQKTPTRGLLRPIKELTRKLNNNYEQIDALIHERRVNCIKSHIHKVVSQEDYNLEALHLTNQQSKDTNLSLKGLFKDFDIQKVNNLLLEESYSQRRDTSNSFKQSPPFIRMKTSDMSPLQETIEISEGIIAGGTLVTDPLLSESGTPSDFKNVSQFLNQDNSINYSVIDVEYKGGQSAAKSLTASQRKFQSATKFIDDNQIQTCRQFTVPQPIIGSENNIIISPIETRNFQSFTKENLALLSNNSLSLTPQSRNHETQLSKSVISKKENGKKKINQYIVIKDIGKGSFGKVKLVLNAEENNRAYAMKILSKKRLKRIFIGKNRTAMNDVMQEIAVMKKLNHENVVKLYEVLDDPTVDKLYIIMEFVKNGSLLDKLGKSKTPISPNTLWKYFRDLLKGLHYLHETAGIIHRDIKPENLLIDENDRVKISDFGVSYIIENGCDEIQSTAGSNYFFAPEICSGVTYKGNKSDIWATGVTLYFMMFKKFPFTANSIPQLYNKVLNEEPVYPSDGNQQLIDLLKKIFVKDPKQRASLQDVISHDWVTCNNLQPLQLHLYPSIQKNDTDAQQAIQKVSLIAKIRLRIKQKVEEQKKLHINKDTINSMNGSTLVNSQQNLETLQNFTSN